MAPIIFKKLDFHDPGSIASEDPAIETETPKILATLSEARKIAAQHSSRFALIYSPSVGNDMTKFKARWDKGVLMLMDWAMREDVPVVDMRRDYARHPSSEVYLDGIHLKPLGHQLMEKAFLRQYVNGQL